MPRYAIARFPTPVLRTPSFTNCFGGEKGDRLALDDQLLLRPIEMVLLPDSKIELKENIESSLIWRIDTHEHPCEDELYVDERFVAFVEDHFPERSRALPSVNSIILRLKEQVGTRYIWGGNWPQGISQLLEWYRPSVDTASLDALTHDTWQLKGVDCSGLLYFATNGCTPRNTSELLGWEEPVLIAGKKCDAIAASLLPLDLIVWKGHVIIVLDEDTVIESKGGIGVVTCSLDKRLQEILNERKPADRYLSDEPSFVIRRWHKFYTQKIEKLG